MDVIKLANVYKFVQNNYFSEKNYKKLNESGTTSGTSIGASVHYNDQASNASNSS